jgi:hypothetical protein
MRGTTKHLSGVLLGPAAIAAHIAVVISGNHIHNDH